MYRELHWQKLSIAVNVTRQRAQNCLEKRPKIEFVCQETAWPDFLRGIHVVSSESAG
jgi:hypothetical protein